LNRWLPWILLLVALVALAESVRSNVTHRRRKAEREVYERVHGAQRFVDMGVLLRVVRADDAGEELIPGKPPLVVLREHRLGGMVDTSARPAQFCGPSRDPVVWYCSEEQEPLILHGDDVPLGLLVYGSEGAGKTVCLAMWHFVRVLQHLGEVREGGQTAPTEPRLEMVRAEMFALYRPTWYRYRASEGVLRFADGTQIRLVSTHRQSEAQGSRVQGFSWSWCGRDECQDQVEAHEDIESRGRAAANGNYRQLATATAKDNPRWRTFRDALLTSGLWVKRTLLISRSPFVHRSFIEAKKRTMSKREYERRMLAMDVRPERATYHAWDRGTPDAPGNLRPRPRVGAKDITARVLYAKTGLLTHTLLAGHDPGSLKRATEFLRAYQLPGEPDPAWWVVGEVYTEGLSCEAHGLAVLEYARKRWGVNQIPGRADLPQMHMRCDPYGKSDKKPDKDVFRILARLGIDIKAAQYSVKGEGTGRIARESRIEMINRLLCDANGRRRLYVDCDDRGEPVAPKLVEGLEASERDELGRPEIERKDSSDLSDCPAALGYALWPWEKEAAQGLRDDIGKEIL
jgi:hypothetical protein